MPSHSVSRQSGDIHVIYDYDDGRWLYASGPAFPGASLPVPSNGALFFRTDLGAHYVFDAGTWIAVGGGGTFSGFSMITVGTTAPVAPSVNDLWVDTT